MSPGTRATSVPSGTLIYPAIWQQQIWAENWGLGGAGSPSNKMWPGLGSTRLPSGIFIHPVVCPQQTWAKKWGAGCCAPFGRRQPGPCLTQCGLGQAYLVPTGILIHPAVWQQYMGQKVGGCFAHSPLWMRGAGFPFQIMSPGPRSTSIPSGILINPAVWPQQICMV